MANFDVLVPEYVLPSIKYVTENFTVTMVMTKLLVMACVLMVVFVVDTMLIAHMKGLVFLRSRMYLSIYEVWISVTIISIPLVMLLLNHQY